MTSGIKNYFDNNVKEIRTEGYEKNNAKYAYEFLKKSKKILYVGSGDGMMIKELLKINKLLEINGVEISSKLYSLSKKNVPDIKIFNENIFSLKLKNQYDTIISFSLLQYFDTKQIIQLQKKLIDEYDPKFIIHLSIPNYDKRYNFLEITKKNISSVKYFILKIIYFFGYKIFTTKPLSYYHKINSLKKLDFKNYSSKFNLPSDSFYRFDYILENLDYRKHKI
jgi:cyclopropane fatty-acyl-phospholipid synthase-like methyltransferase